MGQDQDDVVYVPLTTAQERLLGITYVQSISIQVSSPEKIEEVQNNLTNSPIPKGRGFCFTGNSLFSHRKTWSYTSSTKDVVPPYDFSLSYFNFFVKLAMNFIFSSPFERRLPLL